MGWTPCAGGLCAMLVNSLSLFVCAVLAELEGHVHYAG